MNKDLIYSFIRGTFCLFLTQSYRLTSQDGKDIVHLYELHFFFFFFCTMDEIIFISFVNGSFYFFSGLITGKFQKQLMKFFITDTTKTIHKKKSICHHDSMNIT